MKAMTYLAMIGMAWTSLAAPASAQRKDDKVKLQIGMQPGQVYRFGITVKNLGTVEMNQPMPGQRFIQVIEEEFQARCIDVTDEGQVVMEMSIPRMAMKMNYGGMNFQFDSAAPRKEPTSSASEDSEDPEEFIRQSSGSTQKFYEALTRLTFTATMDRSGDNLEIHGLKEGLQKAVDECMDSASKAEKMMLSSIFMMLDDDMISESLDALNAHIPQDREWVAPGDTWTRQWDMDIAMMGIKFVGHDEFTVVGYEEHMGRPCVKLAARQRFESAELDPAQKKAGQPGNLMSALMGKMDFAIEGSEGKGIIWWDYENGVQVEGKNVMDMEIAIDIANVREMGRAIEGKPAQEGGNQSAEPFKMTQKLKTATTMKLIDAYMDPEITATRPAP